METQWKRIETLGELKFVVRAPTIIAAGCAAIEEYLTIASVNAASLQVPRRRQDQPSPAAGLALDEVFFMHHCKFSSSPRSAQPRSATVAAPSELNIGDASRAFRCRH
jgi:hypothetical protein